MGEMTSRIMLSSDFWLVVAIFYFLFYVFRSIKKSHQAPAFINIAYVFKNYKNVFLKKADRRFFLILPLLLSLATQFNQVLTDDISNVICVILSVLEATVLSFMAMSKEKDEVDIEKELNLDDYKTSIRASDAIAVGMYEVVIGIFVLVLNFLFPITSDTPAWQWIVSLMIYFGFYIFLLNLIVMVRRLYQLYFHK